MEDINRKEVFKNEIMPILNKLSEVCNRANIPYACQFDLKDIEHDNEHYMAMACDTMWSKEINYIVRTMGKVQDRILP